jgi:predicted HAD superfamily phosphohydrolase
MDAIDWKAPARLHERDDSGSDMHYHFKTLREGSVGELVHHVSLLGAGQRARLVLEIPGGKTLDLAQILELAARNDLRE